MAEISGNKILNHAELEEELRKSRAKTESQEAGRFKKYHSLDSDEEDEKVEAQKYNVLDPNELEGQEEKTIDYDDEIKITPFNMKEELEEGYFDKDGTYIFQKEEGVVKDQWLDDIDWVKVKSTQNYKRKGSDDSDDDSNEELPELDPFEHYKKMLAIMKPRETVQKAIVRLGGSKTTASSRWKKKKENHGAEEGDRNEEDSENLKLLTSYANDLVQSGNMDIYQQTYEKLAFHVSSREKANAKEGTNTKDDSELDMFGDDFEEKVEDRNGHEVGASGTSPDADSAESSEVMWEFKWESQEDAKVYGPYPTSQMLQWVQEKYFENGVLVRQIGKQGGQFYSSKRIDFELYL